MRESAPVNRHREAYSRINYVDVRQIPPANRALLAKAQFHGTPVPGGGPVARALSAPWPAKSARIAIYCRDRRLRWRCTRLCNLFGRVAQTAPVELPLSLSDSYLI